QPVIDRSDVGNATVKSKLKITPDVPGRLTYTGVSELTCTPSRPLEFETDYKVELQAVETRDGVLEPSTAGAWTHSFKTPTFALLGWAPSELDVEKHPAPMEIEHSAPLLSNVARTFMTFTIDG